MKKISFTCPHCGGHELITEQPLQWIQYDVLGWDDDGDLVLDRDRPSIVDDDSDKYDIFCKDCEALFSLASIKELT